MTKEQMFDALGQAHTLNLLSAEQHNSLVDAIDREGWRDVVEYLFLELGRYVEDRQIRACAASGNWRNNQKVMQLVSQDGDKGCLKCKVCGFLRSSHKTVLGDWKRGTWSCPKGCKLPTAATTGTDSGS